MLTRDRDELVETLLDPPERLGAGPSCLACFDDVPVFEYRFETPHDIIMQDDLCVEKREYPSLGISEKRTQSFVVSLHRRYARWRHGVFFAGAQKRESEIGIDVRAHACEGKLAGSNAGLLTSGEKWLPCWRD